MQAIVFWISIHIWNNLSIFYWNILSILDWKQNALKHWPVIKLPGTLYCMLIGASHSHLSALVLGSFPALAVDRWFFKTSNILDYLSLWFEILFLIKLIFLSWIWYVQILMQFLSIVLMFPRKVGEIIYGFALADFMLLLKYNAQEKPNQS